MKFRRIGIITLLLIVIILLISYIVIISNPSLLQIPINFYLKRYNINSKFDKLKINSPQSVEINGFSLKNSNMSFYADKLKLSINKSGQISIVLKNPTITLLKTSSKKGNSSRFAIPFRIYKADITNLSVTVLNKGRKILEASGVNIKIDKDRLTASGKFLYKTKTAKIDANIKLIQANFKLSKTSILFSSIDIDPIYAKAKVKEYAIDTKKPIKINGLEITFSPFGIKLLNIVSDLQFKPKENLISAHIEANVVYKKYFELFANINRIKSSNSFIEGGRVNIKATIKKKRKILITFDNISTNYRNTIAQGLCGTAEMLDSNIKGTLFSGESILLNRWYINFKNNNLNFNFNSKKPYKLDVDLNRLFMVNFLIDKNGLVDFSVTLPNVKEAFKTFVCDAYESDFLGKMDISNNQARIKGKYNTKSGGFFITAFSALDNMSYDKKFALKDVSFKIPVIYNFKGKANGFLKIQNIVFKGYHLTLNSEILSTNNTIMLKNRINSKNKTLQIEPFSIFANLKSKIYKTSLIFRLKIDNTSIVGRLGHIIIKNDKLKAYGNVKIKAFGGIIHIHNIAINSIFDMPILCADIDFEHINLEDITKNTNFGLVSGYIKGYIHNLALVNFQNPLSFNMLIKTQNIKGASKRITLKAVNSISKIGGGYVKIAIPFFKSFPYSKIGVYATLKNNRFTMHGLYKEGNKEYIIKKGFLVGVSVVNMNKNNSISWDDMIERIKRVLKSNDVEIK